MSQSTSPRLTIVLVALVVFVVGAIMAAQARVNGDLAVATGDPLAAASISFGSGLVILLVVALAAPSSRRGFGKLAGAIRSGRMPWWYALSGLSGAVFVLTQSLTAAPLGVALFTVSAVSGQILGGLIIDRVGLGSMTPKRITMWRLIGAVLALFAVVLAVSDRLRTDVPLWMLVLPFAIGIMQGWQQAANGQLREHAMSAVTAATVSFAVGMLALAVATGIHWAFEAPPTSFPSEWWLYTGGAMGAVFVTVTALIVRTLGVLLMGLCVVAGQLAGSLVLDLWLPAPGTVVHITTLLGTALVFVAVLVATIRPRRRRAR
ncbi:DMT family transporter [Ruicaihuangia caeni]|uniref:DMT family transporter n=1 Tax=Ruicaihuangia caeni TaxID=3042517 RepID=A0AAW6T9P7_9MICO|nr:DMT family transporter [Klugiella sp. YN-L-19]MDI2098753.1 DMT family transporter [Klugiella sp. YN-L-19]